MDIIHIIANYGSPNPPGIHVYINNNGFFNIYDTQNNIPSTAWNQLKGYGQFEANPIIKRALPVNINNDGKLDFISILREIGNDQIIPNITTDVFYSIISK